MRWVARLGVMAVVGCAAGCELLEPLPDETVLVGVDSAHTYVWHETRWHCVYDDCPGEVPVRIANAWSGDHDVVEVAGFERNDLSLQTRGPGSTIVSLVAESNESIDLLVVVEPLAEIGFPERRAADTHVVMLPGTTAALELTMQDRDGNALFGAPALELRATSGASAESMPSRPAILVTAPSTPGPFEIRLAELGTILTGDVVVEGDIDGLTAAEDFVAPTVGGHVLASGPVEHRIAADSAGCWNVDAEGWGGDPTDPRHEAATWFVTSAMQTTGDPCDLLVVLPLANGGEGLMRGIDG